MSKTWKTVGGITLIAIGVVLLFSIMGARLSRARSYDTRIAAAQAEVTQQATSSGDSTSASPHGYYHRSGGFARGGHTPISFIGTMFKLLALGLIAYLIWRFLKRRSSREPEPVAKIIDEEDVESGIRVGDEIDNNIEVVDPDEMTADDLVRAMKRLGIKKLEL